MMSEKVQRIRVVARKRQLSQKEREDGFLCIVFGQSGIGKTYTMQGSKEAKGIYQFFCHDLFIQISKLKSSRSHSILNIQIKTANKIKHSQILFIDLAGMENLQDTYLDFLNEISQNQRYQISTIINKLSVFEITLSKYYGVISALRIESKKK